MFTAIVIIRYQASAWRRARKTSLTEKAGSTSRYLREGKVWQVIRQWSAISHTGSARHWNWNISGALARFSAFAISCGHVMFFWSSVHRILGIIYSPQKEVNEYRNANGVKISVKMSSPEHTDWIQTQMKTLSHHSDTAKASHTWWNSGRPWTYTAVMAGWNRQQHRRERFTGSGRRPEKWLFVGSDSGGEHAAVLYSLMAHAVWTM